MQRLFDSLLAIETLAELKLTLCVLAKAAGPGEDTPAISYSEFAAATGFSPATIAKGLIDMHSRGYILRCNPSKRQAARYQVVWDRLGMPSGGAKPFATVLQSGNAGHDRVESYFTATGFLDLLPQARQIAHSLGYGEDEMIQAAAFVFDKQRVAPPTLNRTGWFITVFTEKIKEADAQIRTLRSRTG